jgi:predicted DNA-binding protein YlxM (UPF0122 family)
MQPSEENKNFVRQLIKGKIAEVIFEQLFRATRKYTILHFGYEYTLPEIAQYNDIPEIQAVISNIKNAPDFVLVSNDKTEVHLVEVKYRSHPNHEETKILAHDLLSRWKPSWLFIATPTGFFYEPCNAILNNDGDMQRLFSTTVDQDVQDAYLNILNEFERGH